MAEISWPWQYSFPPFFTKTWRYINEGNAHIVIGIEEENADSDYVLRLIKEDGKRVQLNNIRKSADFVNLVMIPLISNTNYAHLEIVEIPAHEVLELTRDLAKFRPKERLIKSKISCYAIKTRNFTILNPKAVNYCVEIKPKEGFMANVFNKYVKCYFCLKQHLKLHEQQICDTSEYCPLDLFSGDRTRMKTALFHLSENPQNNFKLFENGQITFSETNKHQLTEIIRKMHIFKSTDVFFDFIVETLLSVGFKQNYHLKTATIIKKPNNCENTSNLNEQTVLYKILQTQKLAEKVKDIPTATINLDSTDYVSSILDHLDSETNLYTNTEREKFLEKTDSVHLALIAAIAKDCSIMITFTNQFDNDDDCLESVEVDEHKIAFKLFVTDLEPKLPKTLVKRKETERKLIELYEKHLSWKKDCVSMNNKWNLDFKFKTTACFWIQPHSETRSKQLEAWQQLIAEYLKTTKQSTIDIRESQNMPLFNNQAINRKLSQESILVVLEFMAKVGQAAPLDKSKNVWEVYWHSLDEWGNMVYTWASNNGMNNSVCTLFELREGENTVEEEFHGLDMTILIKALKSLEAKGKCELIEFDDHQGVKFF